MNTLQTLQSGSTPHAELSPPTMNTTQPTIKHKGKKPHQRMASGALMRRDQDIKGHQMSKGVIGDERSSAKSTARYGGFGTIGSKLSRPSR